MRKALIAIIFLVPSLSFASTYGSNFLTGGSISATIPDCGGSVSNLVDGNTATIWCMANDTGSFIQYDLGTSTAKSFGKLRFYPYGDGGGNGLKNFTLFGSQNGTAWTAVYTGLNANNLSAQWSEFTTTTAETAYRYFKVASWDSYRTPSGNIALYEWEIMECLDCAVASSTATSTIGFMSPQLDFMLQLFIEALFVLMGLLAGYLLIKKFTKR